MIPLLDIITYWKTKSTIGQTLIQNNSPRPTTQLILFDCPIKATISFSLLITFDTLSFYVLPIMNPNYSTYEPIKHAIIGMVAIPLIGKSKL